MSKQEEQPVIELVPKSPFRWKIVVWLIVLWLVTLVFAFYTKSGLLRLLLPLIIFIIVVYVGYCAVKIFRQR